MVGVSLQLVCSDAFPALSCKHVRGPPPVLATNLDSALDEKSIYELLLWLDSKGWQHVAVAQKRDLRRRGHSDTFAGEAKVWVTFEHARAVSRSYLLCLAKYPELQRPVPHLKSEKYYAALLKGEPPSPKHKRRRRELLPDGRMSLGNLGLPKGVNKTKIKITYLVIQRCNEVTQPSVSHVLSVTKLLSGELAVAPVPKAKRSKPATRTRHNPLCPAAEPQVERAAGSSSSSSSRSSSTTSSSSKASSRRTGNTAASSSGDENPQSAQTNEPQQQPQQQDALPQPHAQDAPLPQQPNREDARLGAIPGQVESWGLFAAHFRSMEDDKITIQVRCKHPRHPAATATSCCSRTRTVKSMDQVELLIRRLKHWCLRGLECDSKATHMAIAQDDAELPSMEVLDAALQQARWP